MATYTKSLKSIRVTTRNGNIYTANDTVENPIATRALGMFLKKEVMKIFADPHDEIPFHAVEMVEVSNTVGSFDREDAYCKVGSSKVCSAKACEATTSC